MDLAHFFPSMLTALLASLVECVEALTVILAVGAIFGWRDALLGAGAAVLVLIIALIGFGPAFALMPTMALHLVLGLLLFAFGLRWLRKAVLRAAGILPKRDEEAAYVRQSNRLQDLLTSARSMRSTGWWTAFQITMIEGAEVIFVVLAIGSADRQLLAPASVGAALAVALVAALGVVLHRPLARIPDNVIKFVVGILTSAFGLFWFAEGLGVKWPGDDWSILGLAAAMLVMALLSVQILAARAKRIANEDAA